MITHMIGMLILLLTYGAFWHLQPARREKDKNDEKNHRAPLLGRLATRALEWLVLMPHVSPSAEKEAPVLFSKQRAMAEAQTEIFRSVLRNAAGRKPQRRILIECSAAARSISASLFKSEPNGPELASERPI